jgi:hypothetical protein
MAVRRTTPGELGVGVPVCLATTWWRRWQESRSELVEWLPSGALTLKSVSGGVPSLWEATERKVV